MCGAAVVTGDVISRVGARDGNESSERVPTSYGSV